MAEGDVGSGFVRRASRRLTAVGAGLTLVFGWAPAAAAADQPPPYQFTIRAAAVEQYLQFFREIDSDLGFSRVLLSHFSGAPAGSSTALGASYWLLTDDAPCLLGCEPPCPKTAVINPTVARTANPKDCDNKTPGLAALGVPAQVQKELGEPSRPRSDAATPSTNTALASARIAQVAGNAGFQAAAVGSESTATVDPITGHYVGTSRGYVLDLHLAGDRLATVTSLLRVTAEPSSMPKVDYLLSLVSSGGNGWQSGVDQGSFTIAGSAIPLSDFLAKFNAQLATLGSSLGNLADLGVRVLAPATD
ncbi:MAG: hypothetical protein JO144_07165, partial [Actinobacteria bacterium]|nr:hypothetical protein [Actinomycetota bacterium]